MRVHPASGESVNRPLAITQRQVRAICEGARKAGCVPVFEVGNILIKLIPENLALPPQEKQPVDRPEEDFEL